MLKIYNTLSHSDEEFKPINPPQVYMYTCGPTVYDYPHIGNLRTFLLSDLLQRILEFNGYKVKSVQNITDIDDKIIKKAKEKNIPIEKLTKEYEEYFLEDIKKLNIREKDEMPHATEYVKKMQDYIKVLLDKDLAYVENDARLPAGQGSVYFDISRFKNYGKLSGIDTSSLKTGARILSDEYSKDDVVDFALWKAEPKDEVGYDSPWGWGRPGWHIECSVMSQECLGETFDIHAGGVDLLFPHHENEIAQSEGKTGKKFVNLFVHGAHILVEGQKMSKSLGNFYRLKDVTDRGFDPLSLRYLYLQTHYRQEMNFTWEALEGAQNALEKLRREIAGYDKPKVGCAEYEQQFADAINKDMNMSKALSVVWEVVNSSYPTSSKAQTLFKFDEILGLSLQDSGELAHKEQREMPKDIKILFSKREALRKEKKYAESDKIREKIIEMGYKVEDN